MIWDLGLRIWDIKTNPKSEIRNPKSNYAKKKSCCQKRYIAGPDLQQRDGYEIHQRRDVGGEKIGG